MKNPNGGFKQFALAAAAGLGCGIIACVISFETMSIVFFGLGLYGKASLISGAVMGLIVGGIFGPPTAIFKLSWRRAACLQVAVCASLLLLFQLPIVYRGTVYSSIESAISSTLVSLLFVALSSTFGAMGTVFLIGKFNQWALSRRTLVTHQASHRRSDRPYQL